jgi:hypothetical protein
MPAPLTGPELGRVASALVAVTALRHPDHAAGEWELSGAPYVWGRGPEDPPLVDGMGGRGYDCSGLVSLFGGVLGGLASGRWTTSTIPGAPGMRKLAKPSPLALELYSGHVGILVPHVWVPESMRLPDVDPGALVVWGAHGGGSADTEAQAGKNAAARVQARASGYRDVLGWYLPPYLSTPYAGAAGLVDVFEALDRLAPAEAGKLRAFHGVPDVGAGELVLL